VNDRFGGLTHSARFGTDPIEVAPDLWWVGGRIEGDPFQCHSYLLRRGDQSVLFDPGSTLTWPETRRKVETLIAFEDIRWFVVHHQDPDICGAMPEIDQLITRDDAAWVSHWRAAVLLKHYDPSVPFWLVDEHDWRLDLGGRTLEFVFTPYLHFPGAFASFDQATGTLMSSDLFGAFTDDDRALCSGLADFDGVRAFHQHYMPDRSILLHTMIALEKLPIRLVAPQHGRLIAGDDVVTYITRLKNLEVGIYLLADTDTDIRRLQALNDLLHDAVEIIATEQDFRVIAAHIFDQVSQVMPVRSTDIVCSLDGKRAVWMTNADRFRGTDIDAPPGFAADLPLENHWTDEDTLRLVSEGLPVQPGGHDIVLPLFRGSGSEFLGIAVLAIDDHLSITPEIRAVLRQVAQPLGVAVERELINRTLDAERQVMYERSIRDPLTGLFTRRYLDDSASRLIDVHRRNEAAGFCLLMADIDHFKAVNDTYGHLIGDEVLVAVSEVLHKACRQADFAVRFGGEEFAVLMPLTPIEGAFDLAGRLRAAIEALKPETKAGPIDLTISLGVAIHRPSESLADTLKKADTALYRAKETGRNQVCVNLD